MAGCCDSRACDRTFGDRFARKAADRYRSRGLPEPARRVVDILVRRGVAGASVLEIGGGVGQIQLELLKAGAARTTNLELSPAYDEEARRLAAEAGVADRVERRLVDIAAADGQVEPADVVVLHRVVCCYPDYVRLLGAAADHARHRLVFSHPPRNLLSRAFMGVENLGYRLRGSEFRVFAHPPASMLAVLAEHGLRTVETSRGRVWHIALAER